jgi:hypothetical protein
MSLRTTVRRVAVATAAGALTVSLAVPASAAPSATTGLYGAADPAYDGVFRQSLALMGLAATTVTPPVAAVTWLLDQQCADGSFQPYRADLSQPCPAADPVNYTGPDTNSTAMALMALMALDDDRIALPSRTMGRVVSAADRAGRWLGRQQRPDGGWPYYAGGVSDANSTGLSLAAILTQAPSRDVPAYAKASRFLGTLAAPCPAGGGLAYQPGSKVDGSASAQGLVGLVGPMPVGGPRRLAVGAPCTGTAKARAASYLARALSPTGTLTSSTGGADYASTATALLGLVAAGQGRTAVARSTAALKSAAAAFVNGDGTSPGAAGLLLMVAEATGSRATSFGGLNLVRVLNASIRR